MNIINTALSDIKLIEPFVFEDERGFFMETFRQEWFQQMISPVDFVQENESFSTKGVLRGLHYQRHFAQGKLVRVAQGDIFDVAVDVRPSSPTFGQWVGEILSFENKRQLWIPPGFAHGFYVLSETALLMYKCTEYYHPEDEETIAWNDPDIGIQWQLRGTPIVSEKDKHGQAFNDIS